MHYIFVVNGRKDMARIIPDLESQLENVSVSYEMYVTKGIGDATRFVRLYSEFHEKKDVCFVACGGSGTFNEVVSGVIGHQNKKVAFLAYGTSNDLTKYYPGHDFLSVKAMLEGTDTKLDVIKCNDDYSVNVINMGFDAMVAFEANQIIESGDKNGYSKGIINALVGYRYNKMKVVVDGEKISRRYTLSCTVGNAKYCGGKYLCSPRAVVDDGLMEVCLIKSMSLLSFLLILPKYTAGRHLEDNFCRRRMVYRRARHIEVVSKDLTYVSLDGEITASTHYVIDILDKALTMVIPERKVDE